MLEQNQHCKEEWTKILSQQCEKLISHTEMITLSYCSKLKVVILNNDVGLVFHGINSSETFTSGPFWLTGILHAARIS